MWLLVPHFMALDVAGAATQLFQKCQVASIYRAQSNAVMDAAMRQGRLRFGQGQVFCAMKVRCRWCAPSSAGTPLQPARHGLRLA